MPLLNDKIICGADVFSVSKCCLLILKCWLFPKDLLRCTIAYANISRIKIHYQFANEKVSVISGQV